MSIKTKLELNVGDVIRSAAFAYGYHLPRQGIILVDGETKNCVELVAYSPDERARISAKKGKVCPPNKKVNIGAWDKSRGRDEFVVEEVNEILEDVVFCKYELYVLARRLKADGTYDPEGTLIKLAIRGLVSYSIPMKKIKITRTMKRVFV